MAKMRSAIILTCIILFAAVTAEPEYLTAHPRARIHLHALFAFALLVELSRIFRRQVIHRPMGGQRRGALTALYMLMCVGLLLEIAFTYVARTHSVNLPLASRAWSARHWHTNTLGYRDLEPLKKDTTKPRLFFLGDSFTAGHGIEDPKDRFADRTGEALKERFTFFDLGRRGADTRTELEDLVHFPLRPDVVVLQYFVNDIEGVALEAGAPLPSVDPVLALPAVCRPLVRTSYLVNFIYWNMANAHTSDYLGTLRTCYGSPGILGKHLADLERIITHCAEQGSTLLVVAFPMLDNIEGSAFFLDPVIAWLNEQQVPVVDVRPLVKDLPVEERIVNAQDPHPSVVVHSIVSEAITGAVPLLQPRNGARDR